MPTNMTYWQHNRASRDAVKEAHAIEARFADAERGSPEHHWMIQRATELYQTATEHNLWLIDANMQAIKCLMIMLGIAVLTLIIVLLTARS